MATAPVAQSSENPRRYPVVGKVFLSVDASNKFKALVLSIKRDKFAPTRDVIVKWNGSKFTYKPL